jgi:hypothetical protein
MPKRVGQDPFASSLAKSDRTQRAYSERARNPNLFKGNVAENQKRVTQQYIQGFQEKNRVIEQRNMGY